MGLPLRLEGHLRDAGGQDGYDLYLDEQALTDLLNAAMPDAARDLIVLSPWWPESVDVRPWAVITDEDAAYVPMIALGADYGRVRITVERLDD